ncbi:MAG: nucleotidyltransferase family protein [Deltaproteobacteria bacterium]|nr:nucleotidyltransferase family protein [Deltaproteobacteria bacterium]MBW2401040.1 nucleotidyltransferase family protein [Deltaproteobacteria bacterium]
MTTTESSGRPFVSGVVLAAGASTRMGRPKQLLEIAGRLLLQHVVDAALASSLDEVIVVLGHRADEVEAALRLGSRARAVVNPEFAAGQITSLRCGLAAANPAARAAAVLLGDQPTLRSEAIDDMIAAFLAAGARAARPVYPDAGGRPGHPVLLAREIFHELDPLHGDQGARTLFSEPRPGVLEVPVAGQPPPDIDTPEDFTRIIQLQADANDLP